MISAFKFFSLILSSGLSATNSTNSPEEKVVIFYAGTALWCCLKSVKEVLFLLVVMTVLH